MHTRVDTPGHECKLPKSLATCCLTWSILERMSLGPFGQGILDSCISGAWSKGKGLGSKGAPQIPRPVGRGTE